ncbi:uncharacterized protein LOC5570041 isoform X3 [Aedes aegypti]|uniref:C2H2-type domain-containing protein n=1 Tax=Aedes aegypti TaxID=7159 RepID=A0A903TK62_AEDAE|nr:uncharacterized protein LOC5570041 isoform X3 [Aedes aegypti]
MCESFNIMAELGERERINQELREEVHVMLDNARGLILSFKGPEAMRVQLNMQYDKFEAICSDRTRRLKTATLQNLIKFVGNLIVKAGGTVEDKSMAIVERAKQSDPHPQVPESPTQNAPKQQATESSKQDAGASAAQTVSIAAIPTTQAIGVVEQLSAEKTKEKSIVKEISPAKAPAVQSAASPPPKEVVQQGPVKETIANVAKVSVQPPIESPTKDTIVQTVPSVSTSNSTPQKVPVKELISEEAKMRQKPQIPWRTPTRLEPLSQRNEQVVEKPKEKERQQGKKPIEHFVKPIETAKEPERLALKYKTKIKKRPAEDPPNNDIQFKKPTLPSEALFQRRHQLAPPVHHVSNRDPRTYGEYCRMNQQRFENQNHQYFKHRPHAAPPAFEKPAAAAHPFVAPAPVLHSNPLLPRPSQRPAAAPRSFTKPSSTVPSKPQAPPRASVHPTTRPPAPSPPVASANAPKPTAPKVDARKTNPVYSKDEPIPLGKKEAPKKPTLAKPAAAVPEKSQEEPKKDDKPAKVVDKPAQQDKQEDAPKESGLQKNIMDLLKEIGDEEKVKQILDVMNKKSDDEAEDKRNSKKGDEKQKATDKEAEEIKEGSAKKDEPIAKGRKGKKYKRIVSKPEVDSSSEEDTNKKEDGNKKEKSKRRATTGGSREVSALIENVSDWISKGAETTHYTRRRGAIIQPTSLITDSPPAKQTKGRKSNEESRSGMSEEDETVEDEIKKPTEDGDSLLTVTKSPPAPKGRQKNKEGSFVYNDKPSVHYNSSYSSNCALCSFNGSAIVDHYVYEHKQYEVFVSRVSPKMADIIRADLFLTNGSVINEGTEDEKIRFKCYFCLTWQELSRAGWIDHMAAHTGEYRYRCTSCPVMSKTEELESCFYHEKTCLKPNLALYNNIEFQDNHIYGFICNACNYIQVRRVNMERHLKREHPSSDVTCSRFSIVNHKIDAKPIIDEDQIMADLAQAPPTVLIPLHPKTEQLEPCEIVNQPFTEDDEMGEAECLPPPLAPLRRRTDIRLESVHLGPSGIPSDFGHRPFSFKMEQELQGSQISSSYESPMSPEPIFVATSEAEAVVPIIQIQSVQGGFDLNKVLFKHDKDTEYDSDASDKTMDFNMSDGAEGQNGENSSAGGQKSGGTGSQQASGSSGTTSSGGSGGGLGPSGSGSSTGGSAGAGGDDGDDRRNQEFPLPFSIKVEKDEEEEKTNEESTNLENVVIKTEKPDDPPADPPCAEGDFDFVELVLDSTRIEHVAYIEHQSEMLFLCLMPGCQYISKISQDFVTHVSRKHGTTIWDGYCHPCQAQIVIVDNCTINNELQHLLDVHARRKTPTVDVPASTSNVLRIRRIPGDTLSKDSNPPPLAPIMPTGTIIAGASGMPLGTNPIIITSATTISPVSIAGNTIITPTHTIPAQIRPVIQQVTMPSTITPTPQPPALAPVTITTPANVSGNSNIPAMSNLKLNTVRLKPWTNMVTTKNQEHCRSMLEEKSLMCLYKCMSRSCAFTTNNRFFMEQHLQLHENIHSNNTNSRKCWLECAYCDIIATNVNVLLAHIDAEHATCGFQCNLCFYRSRDPTNVVVHQKTYHPMGTVPKRILIMPDHLKSFGDDEWKSMQESLRKNVLPLHCTICKESFFILSAYMTHLMGHEHAMVPCQVCNMTVEKKSMARHLLLHSIGLYECVYCLFGANTKSTMALHVSNAHSSKPLYCCVRYNKKRPDGVDYPPSKIESMELKTMSCTVSPDLFKRCNYTSEQLNYKPICLEVNHTMTYTRNEPPVVTKILSNAIATPAAAQPGSSTAAGPASNIQIQITDEAGRPLIISIPVQNAKPTPAPATVPTPVSGTLTAVTLPPQQVVAQQTIHTGPNPSSAPLPIQMPMISSVQGGVQNFVAQKAAPLPVISSVQGMATMPPLAAIQRNDGLPVISCVQSVAQLPPEGPPATTLVPKPPSLMTITSTSGGTITLPNIPGITITAKTVTPTVLNTTPIITNVQSISATPAKPPPRPQVSTQVTQSPINQLQDMVTSSTVTSTTQSVEQPKTDMYATTVAEADTQSSNGSNGIVAESDEDSRSQSERSISSTPVPSPSAQSSVPSSKDMSLMAKKFASTTQIRIDFLFKGSIDRFDRLEKKVSQMIEPTGFYGTALNICGVEDCQSKFSDPVKLNLHLLKFHNLTNYNCYHCTSRFKTAHELITHVKTHGRHRYLCFLCDKKSHFLKMMILHVQHDHNSTDVILTYLHPKKRDIHNDLVVICPQSVTSGQLQDYVNNVLKEDGVSEKKRFAPDEIDQLPVEEIFAEDMFCSSCDYATKLRKNLKRHLEKAHDAPSRATVQIPPESISIEVSEVPEEPSFIVASREASFAPSIPQPVDPVKLYQCGICKFDCPPVFSDLRTHLYRAHRHDKYYKCAHCSAVLSDGFMCVDKIANHLKLHDDNLYKCNKSGCEYYRAEKHLVLSHIKQSHGNSGSVLILRETRATILSPEWQCDLCETIRPNRTDMVTHMVNDHKLTDKQFKCSYCSYKSSDNDSFKPHFASNHPNSELLIISLFHELPPKVITVSSVTPDREKPSNGEKRYSCGIESCSYVSYHEDGAKRHFLQHHPDQTLVVYDDSGIEKEKRKRFDYFVKYVCNYCQEQCDLIDDIVQHWSKLHKAGGKPLMYKLFKLVRCFYCDKLSTYYDIKMHSESSHPGQIFACIDHQNAFKCGECPYVATSDKTDLLKHFKTYHCASKSEDPCDYMDDEFLHRMLEQNNHLYTCNHCKITYESRYEYENHIDICAFAGEPSSFNSVSKSVRIRYICSCCPDISANEYNIAKHMRTHIAQYNCRYCKREFKHLHQLNDHQILLHNARDSDFLLKDLSQFRSQFLKIKMLFPNGLVLSKVDAHRTVCGSVEDIINYARTVNDEEMSELMYSRAIEMPLVYEDESGETVKTICKDFIESRPTMVLEMEQLSELQLEEIREQVYLLAKAAGGSTSNTSISQSTSGTGRKRGRPRKKITASPTNSDDDDDDDDWKPDRKRPSSKMGVTRPPVKKEKLEPEPEFSESDDELLITFKKESV